MTPEYYADMMRRFSTFCRNFGDNRLTKIACGASDSNYRWTEVLMKDPGTRRMMQGLSLHYYTVCHDWRRKGSATVFDESDWLTTLRKTLVMEELVRKHAAIMDQFDPEKRIGMMVDEWGNWHDVEPGTNPGFLYQQNTLRDALVAAVNLNIFNNRSDRVKMANIAQTINVLQAMILTKDGEMVKTPSYYVFKMYKPHHDALLLPVDVRTDSVAAATGAIPAVHASASKDGRGVVHLSLCNLDPNKGREVRCELRGTAGIRGVSGEVLTAEKMNAFNDFGRPEAVFPKAFTAARRDGNTVVVRLPASSVVVLAVE
jgi:alpha-N-arabinofuranosidase